MNKYCFLLILNFNYIFILISCRNLALNEKHQFFNLNENENNDKYDLSVDQEHVNAAKNLSDKTLNIDPKSITRKVIIF